MNRKSSPQLELEAWLFKIVPAIKDGADGVYDVPLQLQSLLLTLRKIQLKFRRGPTLGERIGLKIYHFKLMLLTLGDFR